VDAWNVTVQRQLSNTMSLEVSYVGSKGTTASRGRTQLRYHPVAAGPEPASSCGCSQPGQEQIQGFSATQDANARRPLCATYDTVTKTCSRIGFDLATTTAMTRQHYNAFEVKLDKRFSQACNS